MTICILGSGALKTLYTNTHNRVYVIQQQMKLGGEGGETERYEEMEDKNERKIPNYCKVESKK
jgi:hypothetical protein